MTVAVSHMAACRVTFHTVYCRMIERLLVQAAISLLLPVLPLDHFAVNCRSFKKIQASVFSKQNNYPVLPENAGLWAKEAGYNNALILSGL